MICKNCGNTLESHEKFCSICGAAAPQGTMNGADSASAVQDMGGGLTQSGTRNPGIKGGPCVTSYRPYPMQRERGMFSYIGKKIKDLATILTIVGVVLSILGGLASIGMGANLENRQGEGTGILFILVGIALMIIGPLVFWLGSYLLYGYGELVDKTSEISKDLKQLLMQNAGVKRQ